MFQLLLRFYDPQLDRILYDGIDIRSLDPADLRRHIRSVPQDPVIQAQLANYPASATVSPHLFKKVEVPGICTA